MKKDKKNIIILIIIVVLVVFSSYFLFTSGMTGRFGANVNRLSASVNNNPNASLYPVLTTVINSSGEDVTNSNVGITVNAESIYKIDKLYYSFDLKNWKEKSNFKKDYNITSKLIFTKDMNKKLYIKVENEKGYISYPYETIINIDKEKPIIKTSNFYSDNKAILKDNYALAFIQYSNDKVNWTYNKISGDSYTIEIDNSYKYLRIVDKAGNISKIKKIGD